MREPLTHLERRGNMSTSPALNFNVFTAPEKAMVGERARPFGPPTAFDPITSTLVYGESDAVLVDALGTVAEAEALARWIALHHRNLTTIYITHGHFDHFSGVSVLLQHFPEARAIATPKAVELMRKQSQMMPLFRKRWPGQLPAKIVIAEPYEDKVFTLEGHELHIIEQGRTDAVDSTSVHVPAIDLVVAGDVLYNQCHMYVGDTTPESRTNWMAALDRLAALNPKIAVAGHKKTGAPDLPAAIDATKRYLTDFGRLKETTSSERELYDAMTELYPDWVCHQTWLMFGFG
jgi:glyoxylase-like metal-dependent hydrolase (beta-lactamase superfamily II)